MNRAEKRNQEKIYKKKMQWAESLRPWQKEFIKVFSFFRCPLLFFTAYQ